MDHGTRSSEEELAAFPAQSSEDHSEGEGEEETGALGLWTPARIGARSTGAFVASVVSCEHAANVCVLSGRDGGLCEAPIRHSSPVLFLN